MVQVDINSLDNVKHVTSYILAAKFISSLVISPRRESQREKHIFKERTLSVLSHTCSKTAFSHFYFKKSAKFLH